MNTPSFDNAGINWLVMPGKLTFIISNLVGLQTIATNKRTPVHESFSFRKYATFSTLFFPDKMDTSQI
jgi:hypothetical protein